MKLVTHSDFDDEHKAYVYLNLTTKSAIVKLLKMKRNASFFTDRTLFRDIPYVSVSIYVS